MQSAVCPLGAVAGQSRVAGQVQRFGGVCGSLQLRVQRPSQRYPVSSGRQRSAFVSASTVGAAAATEAAPSVAAASDLLGWLSSKGAATPLVTPAPGGGVVTNRTVRY